MFLFAIIISIITMAPKKNNHTSDTAVDNNNNQQRQNKEKTGNSQRIGGDGPRAKPIRRSKRAVSRIVVYVIHTSFKGVVFPVPRIHRFLKDINHSAQVRNGAAVYMAGVLEYLVGLSSIISVF